MPAFVRVVPELSLDKAFDYEVPAELTDRAHLGARVIIPFGHREVLGYVIEELHASEAPGIRKIIDASEGRPYVPPALIRLAKWMAEYYCAPLAGAFRCVLPEAVRQKESGYKQRLWVEPVSVTNPEDVSESLSRARAQRAAWDHLQQYGGGWLHELTKSTRISAAAWRALADRGYARISSQRQERTPFADEAIEPQQRRHDLNDEQRAAFELIEQSNQGTTKTPILLHGVTGSGKTEVYLQAIESALLRGQTAVVLVPEIALTPQTTDRFRARFEPLDARVAVLHSHLSRGERHDQWQAIRSGSAQIVIGARSAIFAPLVNLGLIVVDEEHESSYKQEESPHYNARDVAIMRGHFEHVTVLLGSATPSLESYQNALSGKYQLASLTRRVEVRQMPTIHVVDLRTAFRPRKGKDNRDADQKEDRSEDTAPPTSRSAQSSNTPGNRLLAPDLVEAVNQRLERREQVIIFLNRRGYATSLACPDCGHIEMSPTCSIPLTYHRPTQRLICHLSGFVKPVPDRCPSCGFPDWTRRGAGTQKIEEAICDAFPAANIFRMDSDSMRGKNAHRETLSRFSRGEIDILVGTQMIAKGLDFPNVTLVGVVNVDFALNMEDFRASERVFQQLMQVAGRSGRGEKLGEVFIQTRQPFHPAIQFARHHDYDGFAEAELDFRRSLGFPPFQRSILITFRGRDLDKVAFVAEQVAKKIIELLGSVPAEVGDPATAPIERINDFFRFHLFIRAPKLPPVTRALRDYLLTAKWPDGVKSTVDIDPLSLL